MLAKTNSVNLGKSLSGSVAAKDLLPSSYRRKVKLTELVTNKTIRTESGVDDDKRLDFLVEALIGLAKQSRARQDHLRSD